MTLIEGLIGAGGILVGAVGGVLAIRERVVKLETRVSTVEKVCEDAAEEKKADRTEVCGKITALVTKLDHFEEVWNTRWMQLMTQVARLDGRKQPGGE